MALTSLHRIEDGPLRVVGFMSGSGTNLRRIIERQVELAGAEGKSPFEVVVIFSNDIRSKAPEIGADFDIPIVIRDIRAWYKKRGAPITDMKPRREFDTETVKALSPFGGQVAAFGGYMAIATEMLIKAYLSVNVHPADLSILDDKGGRKFTGDHAVLDAILAGEKTIASSTHIVEPDVDMGKLLMVSEPVAVEIPVGADMNDTKVQRQVADANQGRLKEKGDWVIFPRTIEYIARGRYARDYRGNLYFDGEPIPGGVRLKK